MAGVDYQKLHLYQLKTILKSRDMHTTGLKDDLVKRLAEDDNFEILRRDIAAREVEKAASARKGQDDRIAESAAAEEEELEKKKATRAAKEKTLKKEGKDDASRLSAPSTPFFSNTRTLQTSPNTKPLGLSYRIANKSNPSATPPSVSSKTSFASRANLERDAPGISKPLASGQTSSYKNEEPGNSPNLKPPLERALPATPKQKLAGMRRNSSTGKASAAASSETPKRLSVLSPPVNKASDCEDVPPKPSPIIKTESPTTLKPAHSPHSSRTLLESKSDAWAQPPYTNVRSFSSQYPAKAHKSSPPFTSMFEERKSDVGFQGPCVNGQVPTGFQPSTTSKIDLPPKFDGSIVSTWSTSPAKKQVVNATSPVLSPSPFLKDDPLSMAPTGPRDPSTHRRHSSAKRPVGSSAPTVSKKQRVEGIESSSVRASIKGHAFTFISAADIHVAEYSLQDIRERAVKNWGFTGQVRADHTGYFFVFEADRRGEREASDFVDECRDAKYRGREMNMKLGS